MVKVYVNNKAVLVSSNTSVLEACELIGKQIPRFCYHERLNVAGNCRMCLVEIANAPKPIASCAYPVSKDMKIFTDTPLVQKARENVLEFLLINHPLDCPICDQGGECDLQEQTLSFGSDRSRFSFEKRGVEDKNCGPLVKTIMTRCIHCTRCVRFFQNVAGQEDFGTTARGKETEIGTYIGKVLSSELSGNIIDLCPVGALTSKPYAFSARPWELKSVDTVDVSDGVGSNIKVNFKETEIVRILPVVNDSVNEEWISDKTRFSFDGLKRLRVGDPFFKNKNSFNKISWPKAFSKLFEKVKSVSNPEDVLILSGNFTDLETISLLKTFSLQTGIPVVSESLFFGNTNLSSIKRLNTSFDDLLDSDFCLFLGTNPKMEASLLNVRLKKRSTRGLFETASIGIPEDLTYENSKEGSTISSIVSFLEGKHPICQKIVRSKKPVIFLGESLYKTPSYKIFLENFFKQNSYVSVLREDWFGLNFVSTTPNFTGHCFYSMPKINSLSSKKVIIGVGIDNASSVTTLKPKFSAVSTSFGSNSLSKCDLTLPSSTFTESIGTFLNMESRKQVTEIAFKAPKQAQKNIDIIETFSNFLEYPLLQETIDSRYFQPEENKNSFLKDSLVKAYPNKFKIAKVSIKGCITDFYNTNAITKNSKIMAECSTLARKNFTNFI
jgi:NADH-quinone oxidoreductase chain G